MLRHQQQLAFSSGLCASTRERATFCKSRDVRMHFSNGAALAADALQRAHHRVFHSGMRGLNTGRSATCYPRTEHAKAATENSSVA